MDQGGCKLELSPETGKLTPKSRKWLKDTMKWPNASDKEIDELYQSIRRWVMIFLDEHFPYERVE